MVNVPPPEGDFDRLPMPGDATPPASPGHADVQSAPMRDIVTRLDRRPDDLVGPPDWAAPEGQSLCKILLVLWSSKGWRKFDERTASTLTALHRDAVRGALRRGDDAGLLDVEFGHAWDPTLPEGEEATPNLVHLTDIGRDYLRATPLRRLIDRPTGGSVTGTCSSTHGVYSASTETSSTDTHVGWFVSPGKYMLEHPMFMHRAYGLPGLLLVEHYDPGINPGVPVHDIADLLELPTKRVREMLRRWLSFHNSLCYAYDGAQGLVTLYIPDAADLSDQYACAGEAAERAWRAREARNVAETASFRRGVNERFRDYKADRRPSTWPDEERFTGWTASEREADPGGFAVAVTAVTRMLESTRAVFDAYFEDEQPHLSASVAPNLREHQKGDPLSEPERRSASSTDSAISDAPERITPATSADEVCSPLRQDAAAWWSGA